MFVGLASRLKNSRQCIFFFNGSDILVQLHSFQNCYNIISESLKFFQLDCHWTLWHESNVVSNELKTHKLNPEGNGSFRPLSRTPWVVSPWVVSPSITWVVSSSYPESFRPLFDESFRPLSKFIFYWGYCDKYTVFVSFNEDLGYIS